MPAHFILSKNACFWHEITYLKKATSGKDQDQFFLDSPCFSHAKTTKQVDNRVFFSWKLNSQRVKLDQAGRPASACTSLYRQKGKINPGDTGSQPKQSHIRGDI
jgi:hypothetical protein